MPIQEQCSAICRYQYVIHIPTSHLTVTFRLTCKILLSEGVFTNFTEHDFEKQFSEK
jgi:hypothetical protein